VKLRLLAKHGEVDEDEQSTDGHTETQLLMLLMMITLIALMTTMMIVCQA